ncbi:hypothetical protein [Methyloceanibacter sp. wino2]|uniref:hypothetical protein n=1 Tax=Methyloceanibacter sp. wino2 TaxID=2170729 RepID=UPI00131EDA78|nr:hypothetical protein [Methyloceanibacter sp. wino2]
MRIGRLRLITADAFWHKLQRFGLARTEPDWLTVPAGLEVCQGMPKLAVPQ